MSKSYDRQNITSFTSRAEGRCGNISLVIRLVCFLAFLPAAFDSLALPGDDSASGGLVNVTDSTEIHFKVSSSGLDLGRDNDGVKLEKLRQTIREFSVADSSMTISSLKIVGSASPEGSDKFNRLLSEKRANAVYEYLTEFVPLPDSITKIEYLGRNWVGLYNLVAADPAVPSHSEVLALLQKAATNASLSVRESNILLSKLKNLKGGKPYIYMYRELFPALRTAYVFVEFENRVTPETSAPEPADSVVTPSEVEVIEIIEDPTIDLGSSISTKLYDDEIVIADGGKPFYMDIRTNMLYDIAAVPNIGAEFYVGKNISVYGNWMYAWWSQNARHRYWRIYGGELGARWWFGGKAHEKPLTGHHIGLYGGMLTFDFEWGSTGYMGGRPRGTLWDRALVNAGIEYGYSLPVSNRLNIDFSLGLGYLGGNYIKYFPFDNEYYRQKEYKLGFFGPTKLEVSLVWLIGRGNHNKRKGGGAL